MGVLNDFGVPLLQIAAPPTFGVLERPSPEDLQEAIGLVEGGLNQARRSITKAAMHVEKRESPLYVSAERILDLRNVTSTQWDLRRLVRMLEELNLAATSGAHMTVAMLVRAITDHVPPIFGKKTFSEVVSNYSGGKSFSEHMKHLDNSLRKVADSVLHQHVRASEVLPSAQQVEFRSPLDMLLGEVVRLLR